MTTLKQIAANRRNAKASTGPKTLGGRSRSRRNALKHGLTASQIALSDERPADLEAHLRAFIETAKPVGAIEECLVLELASNSWRLLSIPRMEADLFEAERLKAARKVCLEDSEVISTLLESTSQGFSEQDVADKHDYVEDKKAVRRSLATSCVDPKKAAAVSVSTGVVFRRLSKSSDPIDALLRYKISLERSYHGAWDMLERLQDRRKSEEAAAAPPAILTDFDASGVMYKGNLYPPDWTSNEDYVRVRATPRVRSDD
jgi:hypothetical protein